MGRSVAADRAVEAIVSRCHTGLDVMSLQREVVERLSQLIGADAVFCASVDPASLLFTSAVLHEIPFDAAPRFLANELLEDDVNKFRTVARQRVPVEWLDRVTANNREASVRYREIMRPLGLGDEMRAAFRSGGETWGFVCMHRTDAASGFTDADARLVARLSTHVGEGLRRALLVGAADTTADPDAPGVLVLGENRTLLATTAAGERWLWELTTADDPNQLPLAVEAVIASLAAVDSGRTDVVPQVRVRTRSGRWAVVHASHMAGLGNSPSVAVVIEPAKPAELAPLILLAHGLTEREAQVAREALRGKPNKAVARELRMSEYTVEDHLKSIFNKVGVSSRGELMARIYAEHFTG